jgi:hypothetical protein
LAGAATIARLIAIALTLSLASSGIAAAARAQK